MEDILVREVTEEDIDQIVEIEKQTFSTPWSKNAFLIEIRENKLAKYIIAEFDKKIVGYGGIWLILNEGHITNIAVKKDYRGKGIGNKLVEGLIDYCEKKDIENMTLEVRKSNIVAQNLYKKYGFVDFGIRPKYYSDNNEDAIIMWRMNK
ncbi:ribosomal protein S18-alanine N-acetyltransferase [Wansuia hejianensis]|uniref:[Ribosomal protein bS18]-alanine N-acetyltransferase n=1 Tax=Wansuia hejianensis TaxID=2763667 RepID=A0A926ILY8_9FIRM|nr:ribosomal protein S18-alanine N-acetyltransferase [Wansuia hejianensis]